MRKEIESALNSIRPSLQSHGGDVELVEVDGGVVKVRLTDACGGCPMAAMTLRDGVERALKEAVPEITEVLAV
jgi:Fe-S cluster biogenesis protein NfuA